jgi:DNA-binding HxlR family transcriptional regulator
LDGLPELHEHDQEGGVGVSKPEVIGGLIRKKHSRIIEKLQKESLTAQELAEETGMSTSLVYKELKELEDKGIVERDGKTYYTSATLWTTTVRGFTIDFMRDYVEVKRHNLQNRRGRNG